MTTHSSPDVTQLLQAWSRGDCSALEKLTPLVYKELHRLAHRYMGWEHTGHVLQTTALVNEAYLRLTGSRQQNWQNRAHFFAISAQLMRQILVDFARSRHRQKRGGGLVPLSLDEAPEKRAALHAKCVVVDRHTVFVSSANFTEAAHERNIEVGLLIQGGWLADRITGHFEAMVVEGLLLPVYQ